MSTSSNRRRFSRRRSHSSGGVFFQPFFATQLLLEQFTNPFEVPVHVREREQRARDLIPMYELLRLHNNMVLSGDRPRKLALPARS